MFANMSERESLWTVFMGSGGILPARAPPESLQVLEIMTMFSTGTWSGSPLRHLISQ
jgi:hypothetical protein